MGVIGSQQATAALRKLSSDAEAMVRAQAIFALGGLKAADEESLKAIVGHLTDKEVQVRRAAAPAPSPPYLMFFQ